MAEMNGPAEDRNPWRNLRAVRIKRTDAPNPALTGLTSLILGRPEGKAVGFVVCFKQQFPPKRILNVAFGNKLDISIVGNKFNKFQRMTSIFQAWWSRNPTHAKRSLFVSSNRSRERRLFRIVFLTNMEIKNRNGN